jgi:hypothetical protein
LRGVTIVAYFDDPANRENWEKAMTELRTERERRQAGEVPEKVASFRETQATHTLAQSERIPVSLQQLIAEDQAARGIKEPGRTREKLAPVMEKTSLEPEMAGP